MAQHETYAERRQQIINGALQAFSEKGYLGTSNRDIARAARINSAALIYHYFENKEALFQAVIQECLPPIRMADQVGQLKQLPADAALQLIATAIIQALSKPQTLALLRLVLAEALRDSTMVHLLYQSGSIHMLAFLYDYFGYLMQHGQIKEADLGATVRCFVGPLFAFILSNQVLTLPDENVPTAEVMIETAVTIFLKGMAP
ncbi:MAG: TetR/AcrR family transcriptional regulator [Caldilineaceae bacterium]